MSSEAEARQIIGQAGAQVLCDVIEGAWESHIAEAKERSRRARAVVVWDYMIEGADARLAPMDGVSRVERSGTPLYVLRDRIIVRFKKHDIDLRPRNYPTQTQQDLAGRGYFEGMPDLDHLTCGYVLDRAEAGLSHIVVVRRVGRDLEWWINLRDLAAGVLEPATPLIPGMDDASIAALPSIAPQRVEAHEVE